MFIIENYSTAVFFCVITMICWGSWANTQKLAASNWRFELFYWDYVLGIVFTALVFGFTLGSTGDNGRSFIEDIIQADSGNIISAIIGGIIFNAANILLVAAISIAGMAVAFPVGIGFALVIGVIVNYLDNPVGDRLVLFSGVGLVVLAIILNAYAYRRKSRSSSSVSAKGLILSISAAILMGFFYRYVAASMFSDFNHPVVGMLSPYSAVFLFSLGILASNLIFNNILMKKPFVGTPVSYSDYFRGKTTDHLLGALGGMIWCIGMSFSIIASGKAGAAISYGLGQGATVVAALWGIFIWKEFKDSPKGTSTILAIMLAFYVAGLAAIIMAR